MKKQLSLRRVVGSIAAAVLAAAAVWLLCRWVGYDLQLRVGNQPVYEIVNDDYTRVIDLPEEGFDQAIPLQAGESLYGVRLRFSTHGQLYRAGMVMVDLCDATGHELRQAAGNYANVFDDNFTGFSFGAPYTAEQAETVYLHIYNAVEWEGPLGLWASETAVKDLPLTADGKSQNATLALQYMTDYSGSWPTQLANELAPLLAGGAFAAVLLAGLQLPLAVTVAVAGLLCGLAFVRVTPALVAPDEYTHLAAAYELASRLGGEQPTDADGNLLVRECDAPYFGTRTGEIGILAYKAEALAIEQEPGGPDELTAASAAKAGQGSGNYLPQALGLRLARSSGAGFYVMLRQARIFNLVFYLMLAVLAVALAPAGVRGLLACVALLPMPLQLAASLSPDASVLGMVFCYMGSTEFVKGPFGARVRSGRRIQAAALRLAGCLWISANLGELVYAARDISLAVLVVGVAALAAAVGLVLWLYDKVHTDPKKLCLFRCGLGCTVVLAVGGGVFALSHMGGGLEPDQLLMTNPNGDSIWTFSLGYICRNLPATTKLLLRTIPEQGALWLQGILGTTLGEPIVYRIDVSWLLGVGMVLALLAAALPVQGTDAPLGRRTKIGVVGIILCVVASSLVVALNWTPINYQTLFGLQGRYWLPILPLVLVLCKCGRNITLRHDTSRGAALAVTACTLLTLLQGFGLYASWQPVS